MESFPLVWMGLGSEALSAAGKDAIPQHSIIAYIPRPKREYLVDTRVSPAKKFQLQENCTSKLASSARYSVS